MKKMLEYLAQSVMDGLKDAEMFYDYAKEAKEYDYPEMASYFLMRAKTRMQMMNEDNAKMEDCIKKMEAQRGAMGEGKWDCLHNYITEEKDKLDYLISSFK